MARIKNDFLQLTGSLGGMTFYKDARGSIVKEKSAVSRERIMTHPRSQGTRENMKEMGGASTAARELRLAFTRGNKNTSDQYFSGRLSGVMRKVIGMGDGPRGKRNLNIRKNGAALEGFEFLETQPLVYSIGGIHEKPELNDTRNEVRWTSPTLNPKQQITAPEEATHFKFILAASGVCNYQYDAKTDEYLPLLNPPSLAGKFDYSEAISLKQKSIVPVFLSVKLSDHPVHEEMGVVTAVGIEFYRNVNGELMRMEKSLAMRVLGVR